MRVCTKAHLCVRAKTRIQGLWCCHKMSSLPVWVCVECWNEIRIGQPSIVIRLPFAAPSQRAQALIVKQRLTDGIISLHLCKCAGPFNCEPNEISADANRVRAAEQYFIHDSIRIFPPSICHLRVPANTQTRSRDPVPQRSQWSKYGQTRASAI